MNIKDAPEYQSVVDTIAELRREEEISTMAAGAILNALGYHRHVTAHPDEMDRDIDEQLDWKDVDGQVWDLGRTFSCADYLWHWAGGFAYPIDRDGRLDKQPLLTRSDYKERDIPFHLLRIAVGYMSQGSGEYR